MSNSSDPATFPDLNAAIQQLIAELEQAHRVFRAPAGSRKGVEAGDSQGERPAAIKALNAVVDFLIAIKAPDEIRAPIFALTMNLDDLSEGLVAPMLVPAARKRGRPPLRRAVQVQRAQLAWAMQMLIAAGDAPPTAARTIARWAKNWPAIAGLRRRHEDVWREVRRWWDAAQDGIAGQDVDATILSGGIKMQDEHGESLDRRRSAEAIVERGPLYP